MPTKHRRKRSNATKRRLKKVGGDLTCRERLPKIEALYRMDDDDIFESFMNLHGATHTRQGDVDYLIETTPNRYNRYAKPLSITIIFTPSQSSSYVNKFIPDFYDFIYDQVYNLKFDTIKGVNRVAFCVDRIIVHTDGRQRIKHASLEKYTNYDTQFMRCVLKYMKTSHKPSF